MSLHEGAKPQHHVHPKIDASGEDGRGWKEGALLGYRKRALSVPPDKRGEFIVDKLRTPSELWFTSDRD